MLKKFKFITIACTLCIAGCAITQSVIKSTFPYTANLTIPASAQPGNEYTAVSMATSFDQNFTKDGNNAYMVSKVHVISAKLHSSSPGDYNIGNIEWAKFYMSKPDGTGEVLVASRPDITAGAGHSIVLDIDNKVSLDQLIRLPHIRIRMVYKLRSSINVDAGLRLVLGLSAHPDN